MNAKAAKANRDFQKAMKFGHYLKRDMVVSNIVNQWELQKLLAYSHLSVYHNKNSDIITII